MGGSPAGSFLQNARVQQIARSDLVNSVEINWVWAPWGRPEFFEPGDGALTLAWLAGFRFFELQDVLGFTSLAGTMPPGATFGTNGGASQLGLDVATNNDIYGAQIGGKADWHLMPGLRLSLVKKVMFGGNAITNTSSMASGSGIPATFPGGGPVQVHSTASAFSLLGQLDAGLAWDITRNWSLSVGYRLVGLADVAQSDAAWPSVVTGPGSLSRIAAAGMVENPWAKGALHVCSTFCGFSRMDANAHYPSQIFLGWSLAFASSLAVEKTEVQFGGMSLRAVPVVAGNGAGMAIEGRW